MTDESELKRFGPVNRCIYCGEIEDLSDEHIVPYALGGDLELLEASCERCSRITGAFEQDLLRGPWDGDDSYRFRRSLWTFRASLGLRSRNPEELPAVEDLTVVRGGKEETRPLPLGDYPATYPLPVYPPPSCLTDSEPHEVSAPLGWAFVGTGPAPQDVADELDAKIRLEYRENPRALLRLIAKIGLCWTVVNLRREGFELDALEEVFVRDAILNRSEPICRWVGCGPWEGLKPKPGTIHRLRTDAHAEGRLAVARVLLFATAGIPTYTVIVGRLRPDALAQLVDAG